MALASELFGALIPLAKTATKWLEGQTMKQPIPTDRGFYDEESDEYVHLDKVWGDVRRLQSEMTEWQQTRIKADEAQWAGINLLLANYRTLADEVNALENRLIACSPMPKISAPNFQADSSSDTEAKLVSLRELCDALALDRDDQEQNLASMARLVDVLRVRMSCAERHLAKRDGGLAAETPDVRALVRDATVDLETKMSALSAECGELRNRLAQFEQRQSTWSKGIDMLLGRRPRG